MCFQGLMKRHLLPWISCSPLRPRQSQAPPEFAEVISLKSVLLAKRYTLLSFSLSPTSFPLLPPSLLPPSPCASRLLLPISSLLLLVPCSLPPSSLLIDISGSGSGRSENRGPGRRGKPREIPSMVHPPRRRQVHR